MYSVVNMKLIFSFLLFLLVCSEVSSAKLQTKFSHYKNFLTVDGFFPKYLSEEIMVNLVERMTSVFRENRIKSDAFGETRSAQNCYWSIEEGLIRHLLGDDVSICFMQAVYHERTPFTLRFNMKYCWKGDRLSGNTMINLHCQNFPLPGEFYELAETAVKANQVYQDYPDVYQRVMGRFRPALDKQLHEIYIELRPPGDTKDAAPVETFPIFNLEHAIKNLIWGSDLTIERSGKMIMTGKQWNPLQGFQFLFSVEIMENVEERKVKEMVLDCSMCEADSALADMAKAAYRYTLLSSTELPFVIHKTGEPAYARKKSVKPVKLYKDSLGNRLEREVKTWFKKNRRRIDFSHMQKIRQKPSVLVGVVFPPNAALSVPLPKKKAFKSVGVLVLSSSSSAPATSLIPKAKIEVVVESQTDANPNLPNSLSFVYVYFKSKVKLPDLLQQNRFVTINFCLPTDEDKRNYFIRLDKGNVLKIKKLPG